jgi:hypothetical protein
MMIFNGEFECMTFLPDYVINALHDIARSEVHLISLTQLLPELPRRDEQLPGIDPFCRALIYEVSE